jgi:hypothetical protein
VPRATCHVPRAAPGARRRQCRPATRSATRPATRPATRANSAVAPGSPVPAELLLQDDDPQSRCGLFR